MTSTSCDSLSDSVDEALRVGGGGSILAIFFLFPPLKKLPKKPPPDDASSPSSPGLAARGGMAEAGRGLPVFGSTCVVLLGGLCFS